MCSRSMIFLIASAAVMFTACPELCPSPCPGAPGTSGRWHATPGICDACGMPSRSEPSAITGFPDPHVATHDVGIPATPSRTVKPFCFRMVVMYFDVSNSWKPSSPKLKT